MNGDQRSETSNVRTADSFLSVRPAMCRLVSLEIVLHAVTAVLSRNFRRAARDAEAFDSADTDAVYRNSSRKFSHSSRRTSHRILMSVSSSVLQPLWRVSRHPVSRALCSCGSRACSPCHGLMRKKEPVACCTWRNRDCDRTAPSSSRDPISRAPCSRLLLMIGGGRISRTIVIVSDIRRRGTSFSSGNALRRVLQHVPQSTSLNPSVIAIRTLRSPVPSPQ